MHRGLEGVSGRTRDERHQEARVLAGVADARSRRQYKFGVHLDLGASPRMKGCIGVVSRRARSWPRGLRGGVGWATTSPNPRRARGPAKYPASHPGPSICGLATPTNGMPGCCARTAAMSVAASASPDASPATMPIVIPATSANDSAARDRKKLDQRGQHRSVFRGSGDFRLRLLKRETFPVQGLVGPANLEYVITRESAPAKALVVRAVRLRRV